MQVFQLNFIEWLKVREDFGQGIGATGASLPLKNKKKVKQNVYFTPNPMFRIDRGQSYQNTKKDDGNG